MYSFGTLLLDLLSGKHIPPSHVSYSLCEISVSMYEENKYKVIVIHCHGPNLYIMH